MDEPEKEQRLETELTYAWNWFQYHAGQRLTAFNFFLVIVGVVAVAFTKALEQGWTVLGAVVAGLGALISIGFLFLDVRNEELVNCGRAALAELERGLRVHPSGDAGDRTHLKRGAPGTLRGRVTRSGRWAGWIAHRRWLRLIEGTVAIAFVFGAIWAATGFAGLEGPAKRAQATAALLPGPQTMTSLRRSARVRGYLRSPTR
ncbi:MAG: hypothetical protein QOD61_2108 [Solirubrobacteraceae bacterium]|nr:hypothetical protein [Solirubrobacteraceae bacterium]